MELTSNLKYHNLASFKKQFLNEEVESREIEVFLDKTKFKAWLKYQKVPKYSKYDRIYKFKICLDGICKNKTQEDLIKKLYMQSITKMYLVGEILFQKEEQRVQETLLGELEYHFIFTQY